MNFVLNLFLLVPIGELRWFNGAAVFSGGIERPTPAPESAKSICGADGYDEIGGGDGELGERDWKRGGGGGW